MLKCDSTMLGTGKKKQIGVWVVHEETYALTSVNSFLATVEAFCIPVLRY